MKITFCLPSIRRKPIGGYKVIYEYSNRLIDLGHEVSIVFLIDKQFDKFTSSNLVKRIIGNFFKRPNWFSLNPKVKLIATPDTDGNDFPNADFVFATAVTTASIVNNLDKSKGEKGYIIQGFENWALPTEEVIETYNYGMLNIVVSKWLEKIVKQSDRGVKLISNAVNTEDFYVTKLIEDRSPYSIAALYHPSKEKGFLIALQAIKKVKEKFPDLTLSLFGASKPPVFLESWMTYTRSATKTQLRDLYNGASIFVCASINEGFGLTGAESMACGCALASTSYQGVFEYAVDGKNALLSKVNDVDELSANIIKLIENDELRNRLALQASKDMSSRTWDRNALLLEHICLDKLNN